MKSQHFVAVYVIVSFYEKNAIGSQRSNSIHFRKSFNAAKICAKARLEKLKTIRSCNIHQVSVGKEFLSDECDVHNLIKTLEKLTNDLY